MLVWENVTLPFHVNEDVLLCPSYSRPLLTRARTVTLTYEATQKLFPEHYPRIARYIHTPLYGWSARNATLVVTNTNEARADIIRAYKAPESKVEVIPLAPADVFHNRYPKARLDEVRQKYVGADVPFFLYVGKLTGRRNVPMIVEALADLKKRTGAPHRVVIVGLNTTGIDLQSMAKALGIEEDVNYYHFVDDEDLAPIYSAATAFVLPYTYESAASLTLIEAQAAGTPVITTGTKGLREVAGNAALFIDQVSPAELSLAMERIATDPELANELSVEGPANAARFSWERSSAQLLDTLHRAATGNSPSEFV